MHKAIVIAILVVSILATLATFLYLNPTERDETIRVGWQPPWVNQGQIAAILQNTSILQQNEIEAKFTGFSLLD